MWIILHNTKQEKQRKWNKKKEKEQKILHQVRRWCPTTTCMQQSRQAVGASDLLQIQSVHLSAFTCQKGYINIRAVVTGSTVL